MSARPPLLFYCQHSVGLGHLTRSYALCAHLAEWFRVVLVLRRLAAGRDRPAAGRRDRRAAAARRRRAVALRQPRPALHGRARVGRARRAAAAHAAHAAPGVVFVELFPFGRAKFARELVPLLELARDGGAMTACSLRDILVTGRDDQAGHDERACRLANAHLDAVLVHSDPRFARLEETFGAADRLTVPVRYTGFVVGGRPAAAGGARAPRRRLGRRRPGRRAAAARRDRGAADRHRPADARDRRAADAGRRLRAPARAAPRTCPASSCCAPSPTSRRELAAAAAAVSQGGYNTTLEIVRAGVPALVVPYATPEEDEQLRRARRLERLGALRVLEPDRLEPAVLAARSSGCSTSSPRSRRSTSTAAAEPARRCGS